MKNGKYKALKYEMLSAALAKANGNRCQAARELGVSPQTVNSWLSQEPGLVSKWPAKLGRYSGVRSTTDGGVVIAGFLGRFSDTPAVRSLQVRYLVAIAKANGNLTTAARDVGIATSTMYHWVSRNPQLKIRETWPSSKSGPPTEAEAPEEEAPEEEVVVKMSDERREELRQKVELTILNLKGTAYSLLSKATDAEVAQATRDAEALAKLGILTATEAAELEAAKG